MCDWVGETLEYQRAINKHQEKLIKKSRNKNNGPKRKL